MSDDVSSLLARWGIHPPADELEILSTSWIQAREFFAGLPDPEDPSDDLALRFQPAPDATTPTPST